MRTLSTVVAILREVRFGLNEGSGVAGFEGGQKFELMFVENDETRSSRGRRKPGFSVPFPERRFR
jgi:hypothetical protein